MMPKIKIRPCLALLAIFFTISAGAQKLSDLGTDPAVRKGSLPNGIRYYLVANTESKGRADFALVRKGWKDVDASRAAASALPTIPDVKPCLFLADKGVGYSPDGCISYRDAGSVFHFRDVPVFDAAAADSTLLIMFDLVRTADCPQAIIISGDIDRDRLADRMYVLSMTIPMLPPSESKEETEWKADSKLVYDIIPFGNDGLAEIRMTVEAPRTPADKMNTAVPFVTGKFAAQLGDILGRRIAGTFKEKGIPAGRIDLIHEDSSVRAGNETYTVSIITDKAMADTAAGVLTDIVDELIRKGADIGEFTASAARIASSAGRNASVSNREYVEKCIRAELYGASLAPASVTDRFLTGSRLSPEKGLPLFNNFIHALLDPESTKERAIDSTAVLMPAADTLSFAQTSGKTKTKLKSSSAEPITGGEMWTFANGMRVIFKKADTPGRFEYGLMIKGGAPVPSQMLGSFDVAGLSGDKFRNILLDNGITMNCSVSEADLRLRGSAPVQKMQLLLRSLASLSSDRRFNPEDYDYWSSCAAVSRKARGFDAEEELEDMMSPDYEFSSKNLLDSLNERLPARAEDYFAAQFSRMNDGVFVIVGDFESAPLQKTLSKGLASFRCGKNSSVRPRIRHDIRQGWYTRMRKGETLAAMSISVGKPFSMDGYMTFKLACTALRWKIVKELASQGMYAEFSEDVEFFPTEAYTVKIVCRPCNVDGLPADIRRQNAVDALGALRRAVNGLSSTSISPGILKACKAELKAGMESACSAPEFLVDAAMTRYSVGRDLLSSWKSSIDKVSAEDVSSLLREMENGAIMEILSK